MIVTAVTVLIKYSFRSCVDFQWQNRRKEVHHLRSFSDNIVSLRLKSTCFVVIFQVPDVMNIILVLVLGFVYTSVTATEFANKSVQLSTGKYRFVSSPYPEIQSIHPIQ